MLGHMPLRFMFEALYPRSNIFRALVVNPGSLVSLDHERIYARNLEVPSGGGVGTARAIARAYGIFATGGRELDLKPDTMKALSAPPVSPLHGFFDECMKGEVPFSLGFMKPSPGLPFGTSPDAFGSPGAGGSMGFADPATGIGYGYVTNRMSMDFTGDPRDVALRDAINLSKG
jgi:CubicO group peptidase (beta-lactamase class C family)